MRASIKKSQAETLTRKLVADTAELILADGQTLTFLQLEKEIQKRLPSARTREATTLRQNKTSLLRNTIAWAKIALKNQGKIEYPAGGMVRKAESGKSAPLLAGPSTPGLKKPERATPAEKPKDTGSPIQTPERSPLQKEIDALLNHPDGRVLLGAAVAIAKLLQPTVFRKAVEWERAPAHPLRLPVEETPLVRLERLSEAIKSKVARGELPKDTTNEHLRKQYAAEGHTELQTATQWEAQKKFVRRGEHALLLWKKTPTGRFVPAHVFSQKQVVGRE